MLLAWSQCCCQGHNAARQVTLLLARPQCCWPSHDVAGKVTMLLAMLQWTWQGHNAVDKVTMLLAKSPWAGQVTMSWPSHRGAAYLHSQTYPIFMYTPSPPTSCLHLISAIFSLSYMNSPLSFSRPSLVQFFFQGESHHILMNLHRLLVNRLQEVHRSPRGNVKNYGNMEAIRIFILIKIVRQNLYDFHSVKSRW